MKIISIIFLFTISHKVNTNELHQLLDPLIARDLVLVKDGYRKLTFNEMRAEFDGKQEIYDRGFSLSRYRYCWVCKFLNFRINN